MYHKTRVSRENYRRQTALLSIKLSSLFNRAKVISEPVRVRPRHTLFWTSRNVRRLLSKLSLKENCTYRTFTFKEKLCTKRFLKFSQNEKCTYLFSTELCPRAYLHFIETSTGIYMIKIKYSSVYCQSWFIIN